MAEIEEVWSLAIAYDGELHVLIDGELPDADNVVRLRIRRDGDLVRFSRDDMPALRQLIGTEVRTELVPSGPGAADELERMLDRVTTLMQSRIDELTGESDQPGYR